MYFQAISMTYIRNGNVGPDWISFLGEKRASYTNFSITAPEIVLLLWISCYYTVGVRPMLMETRWWKVLFPKYLKKKSAEDTLVPPLWKNGGGKSFRFAKYNLFTRMHPAKLVLSRSNLSPRRSKTARVTIDLRSRHRIYPRPTRFVSAKANECRWRTRRYQVDP